MLDESLAQIERPGWEERMHLAEALRLKGQILRQKGWGRCKHAGVPATWRPRFTAAWKAPS